MTEQHRATDAPNRGRLWIMWRKAYRVWAMVVPTVAVVAALIAVLRVEATVDDIAETQKVAQAEILERRDQTCRIFEGQHLVNVNRLIKTYAFLDDLPRREYGAPITRAVIDGLPELEAEARVDQAPEYCDEPGKVQEDLYERTDGKEGAPPIGLPEPDPIVPPRRRFVRLGQQP